MRLLPGGGGERRQKALRASGRDGSREIAAFHQPLLLQKLRLRRQKDRLRGEGTDGRKLRLAPAGSPKTKPHVPGEQEKHIFRAPEVGLCGLPTDDGEGATPRTEGWPALRHRSLRHISASAFSEAQALL